MRLPFLFALLVVAAPVGAGDSPTSGSLTTGAVFWDPFLENPMNHGPEMVFVGPQRFVMGSRLDEPGFKPDEREHPVELSPYSIGRFEVTNSEFAEFLNDRGNQLDGGIPWLLTDRIGTCLIRVTNGSFEPVEDAADRPVVAVSWNGANAFCDWLTSRTGHRYRLPTEAEWECAARAGTDTIWPWGNRFDGSLLQWRDSATPGASVPVGSFPPNPWGIHDMVGNVWEYVVDCVEEDFYARSPTRNPVLYVAQCRTPGVRGGSFLDGPEFCRPGHRINTWWWGEYSNIGFRVAREEVPSRWHRRRQLARMNP